jgi:phosphomevalonate kinase
MRARAPGKLVLSGAYSVLEGAPALVAAVDRYAVADSERAPEIVTDEVTEAIARGDLARAVWFDASALREPLAGGQSRKLGLGSSAAILVASMATADAGPAEGLAARLFPRALAIHRAAQGGGSGIDVAASSFGGVVTCRIRGETLDVRPRVLPDVVMEAWACPESASTSAMLAAVRALAAARPRDYRASIDAAREAAEEAADASAPATLISAIRDQRAALARLAELAAIPMMTAAVDELDDIARAAGSCFYPSGAGGGDIAIHVGWQESTPELRDRARVLGLVRLTMRIGASGVERC